MRVPRAPEASTASSLPDEDEGQRAESTARASPGLGSCLAQKFTRADHWSSSKLRNGEAHCFSSVGGIARLGSGDTGGRGTLEQQTLQLQLLTYKHPVHQEQKASPSMESWCLQGGGKHPALQEDCFTWVTWHSLTPVTLSHVHPLCLSLYFSEIVISQSYSWIHFETPVMIKTN